MTQRNPLPLFLNKRLMRFAVSVWIILLVPRPISVAASDQSEKKEASLRGKVSINGLTVENAVVYLVSTDDQRAKHPPLLKTIVQEKTRFKPSFTVVTVGSTIRFDNRDNKIHNVNSTLPPNRFDIGAQLPKTAKEVVLNAPGIVTLRCKVHEKMKAWIYVSPSPYFALADENGHFKISNIPFGAYHVELWYFNLSPKERAAASTALDFSKAHMDIHLKALAAQPDKDFSDLIHRDWSPVIEEIATMLNKAFLQWKKKKNTAAALGVMVARSKLFHGSGFRKAIARNQEEEKAERYDIEFDNIRKFMQKAGNEKPEISSVLQEKIKHLISDLNEDALTIENL